MKFRFAKKSGFTLVEIMIVVGIIGLLASIAVPNFVKARQASRRSACIANLKKIEDAKVTWAMETNKSTTDAPGELDLFGSDNYLRRRPTCPSSGSYDLGTVAGTPSCTMATVEGHTL